MCADSGRCCADGGGEAVQLAEEQEDPWGLHQVHHGPVEGRQGTAAPEEQDRVVGEEEDQQQDAERAAQGPGRTPPGARNGQG